ncbi:MAG: hypothetical protein HOP19_07790 [Acidobacteria bacterium]|nr:hypothetical protein [Acidobacteriota bacterium]
MKQINYSEEIRYRDDETGIPIEIELFYAGNHVTVTAKVDCGSAVCLFSNEDGHDLGIPVEQGIPKRLSGLTGSLDAFGHEVVIQIGTITFQSTVYFAKHLGLPRNLFGLQGGLRNCKVGLIDYDNMLYLSPYDAT